MAITATVDKFGMTFSDAYHKVNRLTYESYDVMTMVYPDPSEAELDEDGNPVPTPPSSEWVKHTTVHFEVSAYVSLAARNAHAEPIYSTHFSFTPSLESGEADVIAQAYEYLKAQPGYEDAVDC